QVAVRPQEAEGFSGSGSLATFVFAPGAADLVKRASTAPATNHSRAVASFDGNAGILSWGYASQGDYDQNSETNISDLTPLGVHFQKKGPFDYFSVEAVVDGDANGEINIADIT